MTGFPRKLTNQERAVIEFLLPAEFPGSDEYRVQLESAVVAERCPCGCLEFLVVPDAASPSADDRGMSIAAWSEEQLVDLALETRGGYVRGDSLMWYGEDAHRLQPDLSTFAITITRPEDRRLQRPTWWRRLQLLAHQRRIRHASNKRPSPA